MTRQIERWLLPIEGLASGALTSLVLMHLVSRFSGEQSESLGILLLGAVILWCSGLIFGAVIAAHAHFFHGIDSLRRLIGFVATCVVAYPAAFYSQRLTPFSPEFFNFSGTGAGVIDSSSLFFPVLVGSAIVCAGALLFLVSPGSLSPRRLATLLLKALGGSVVCGFLGTIGWALGERAAIPVWRPAAELGLPYFALSAMVQMGVASLVGFLMSPEAAPVAPQPAPRPGLLEFKAGRGAQAAAAAALLILTYGILTEFKNIYVNVSARRELAAQRRLAAERAAERPSLNHLPALVAPPVEQVLLLKDISGHPPVQRSMWFDRKRPGWAYSVSYEVGYKLSETALDDEQVAHVEVIIYPTSAWAVYLTKQLKRHWRGAPAFDPKTVTTVSILGNRVIRDAWRRSSGPGEPLDFYWASGSRVVSVTFWASEDDEFLKEYLIWYPSTL